MLKIENSNEFQYTQVPTIKITEVNEDYEINKIPATYGYGVRHIQLLLFFLCAVTAFFARGHLGVTLVAMTSQRNDVANIKDNDFSLTRNQTQGKEVFNASDDYANLELNKTIEVTELNSSLIPSNTTDESKAVHRTFRWSKSIQEMVLTSFFVGYCLMMLPISLVCQRWGGMVPLQISMLVNGIVSILTPWLAYWGGWQAVCACRLLQGFSQAGTYPGLQTLLSQWVPESEKSTLSSFVYTGTTLGSMLSFQLSGLISDAFGWPATFWSVGALCFAILALITLFGAASPRVHKSISEEEKNYIIKHTHTSVKKSRRVPWKALATSRPLLANYAAAVGSGINYIFFFTQLPSYIHYIYGVYIKNSGLLTSLPYIAGLFASVAFALASEYLTNKNIISKKNTRRCSNIIAQAGMASTLIGASYASNSTTAVVCFVIFMMSYMGIHTGWMINQIDLTPNYSGTLIAISNMLTNLVVMVMPFIISNVILDLENVYQWRIMLFLEASLALIPGIIFAVFLSVDVQPWNASSDPGEEPKSTDLEKIEEEKIENKAMKLLQ